MGRIVDLAIVMGFAFVGFLAGMGFQGSKTTDVSAQSDLLAAANHRCGKNEGAKELVPRRQAHLYDVHCNDTAVFKDVEIKIEPRPVRVAGATVPTQ